MTHHAIMFNWPTDSTLNHWVCKLHIELQKFTCYPLFALLNRNRGRKYNVQRVRSNTCRGSCHCCSICLCFSFCSQFFHCNSETDTTFPLFSSSSYYHGGLSHCPSSGLSEACCVHQEHAISKSWFSNISEKRLSEENSQYIWGSSDL